MKFVNLLLVFILIAFVQNIRLTKTIKQQQLGEELVISNFNHSGVNRMVVPDLAQKRLNCKHMCQSGGSCRACYRAMLLANPEEIQDYVDFTDEF